ncbi:M56 family metallopeptidase [Anaerotruncus rubiinfantis]|uniref:M56 family metallopeptidase n=2 Tax=Anaerotruncus rubiinfantis TaxID=1720200 RepID=UPI0018986093|nr:M56 family metallopeptidase [Anaerotruncus rubiinfantis]
MVKNLFETLLLVSLTTSALIGLLLVLSPLLGRRYPAKWRYWAWLLLAVRLLIPWNFTLPEPPVTIPVAPAVLAPAARQTPPTFTAPTEAAPASPVPEPARAAAGQPKARQAEPAAVLAAAWLAGAGACLIWQFTGYALFKRQVRRWSRPVDGSVQDCFARVCGGMGVSADIQALCCKKLESPMMTGFFAPMLLLPEIDYPKEDLELMLRHELVHFKRRDIWYKLLLMFACAVHWFNPLVWLMARAANRDVEISCDSEVVKGCPLEYRRRYGETILAAIHAGNVRRTAFSTYFYGGRKTVRQRLQGILDMRGKKRGLIAFALMAAAAAVIGGCVVFGGPDSAGTMRAFAGSVAYDPAAGELRFTVPEKLPAGHKLYLHVSGSIRMGADSEMSWHALDTESENYVWELGKTYIEPLEADGLIEGSLDAGLVKEAGGPVMDGWTIRFFPDGRVWAKTEAEAEAFRWQAYKRCLSDEQIGDLLRRGWDDERITAITDGVRMTEFPRFGSDGCPVHTGAYHVIDNRLIQYVGQDKIDAFLREYSDGPEHNIFGADVNIVNFVKFCEIPKTEFEKLVEQYALSEFPGSGGHGYDPDVIYSDDDALIQQYYTETAEDKKDDPFAALAGQVVPIVERYLDESSFQGQVVTAWRNLEGAENMGGSYRYMVCCLVETEADLSVRDDVGALASGYVNLIPEERFEEYEKYVMAKNPLETEIPSPVAGVRVTVEYKEDAASSWVMRPLDELMSGERALEGGLRLPDIWGVETVGLHNGSEAADYSFPVTVESSVCHYVMDGIAAARPERVQPLTEAFSDGEPEYRALECYLYQFAGYSHTALHFYAGKNAVGVIGYEDADMVYTFPLDDSWCADFLFGLEASMRENPAAPPFSPDEANAFLQQIASEQRTVPRFYLEPADRAEYTIGDLVYRNDIARAQELLASVQMDAAYPDEDFRLFDQLASVAIEGYQNGAKLRLYAAPDGNHCLSLFDPILTGGHERCYLPADGGEAMQALVDFMQTQNRVFAERSLTFTTGAQDPVEIGRQLFENYQQCYMNPDIVDASRILEFTIREARLVAGDRDEFCVGISYDITSAQPDRFMSANGENPSPGVWTDCYLEVRAVREDLDRYRIKSMGTGGGGAGLANLTAAWEAAGALSQIGPGFPQFLAGQDWAGYVDGGIVNGERLTRFARAVLLDGDTLMLVAPPYVYQIWAYDSPDVRCIIAYDQNGDAKRYTPQILFDERVDEYVVGVGVNGSGLPLHIPKENKSREPAA